MKDIKTSVMHNVYKNTVIMTVVILVVMSVAQVFVEQQQARSEAAKMFERVERMLENNHAELEEIEQEYRQSCLHNAEVIAHMLSLDPTALDSVTEFRQIARIVEVDEIHIFDQSGTIINGTHPEYFGMDMDSGEQIAFFKPMLEDKTLQMCQDITPNTAEQKLEQYSAVWSQDGEYIVQVGMEPASVLEVTAKNELSYIFTLLKVSPGVDWYAVDSATGEIMGSTISEVNGSNIADIGLELEQIWSKSSGFHAIVNGVDSYCVFQLMGDNLVGRVISSTTLYRDIPIKICELALIMGGASLMLGYLICRHLNRNVISSIYNVNEKLRAISAGNLDERVDIRNRREFAELSDHINDMIKSLLSSTDKMSYVLDKTDLRIGVYEYNAQMQSVRFTEYVPSLLGLDKERAHQLSHNYKRFQQHIDQLRSHPVPGEERVYRFDDYTAHYVKIDEVVHDNDVLGVILDVTDDFALRQRIENERDMDLLTNLYNRRGMETRLDRLFSAPEDLGCGALLMIDGDGLKGVNDRYGHNFGDIYLRRIAEAIAGFGSRERVAARYGGDEFVLFLYGYDDEAEIDADIRRLEMLQDTVVKLGEGVNVPLGFSFGYELTRGENTYAAALHRADVKMYASKQIRKQPKA